MSLINNGDKDNSGSKMKNREKISVFLFLAVIIGLLYVNSLKNGFFLDDYTDIIENQSVQHPENFFRNILEKSNHGSQDIKHFRPLPFVYRVIVYQVFRQKAFYYHLANIIFFLILCYLIFVLIHLLTRDKRVSLVSTVLFAVHPHNTTAVNFVTGDGCLFYAILCVLMTIYFIRYLEDKSKLKYYVISIICYPLAILCHDVAFFSIPLIFFIALLGYQLGLKASLKLCLPYVLCAFAYCLFRFLMTAQGVGVLKGNLLNSQLSVPIIFFASLKLVGWYFAELFVPLKFVYMWSLRADHSNLILKGSVVFVFIVSGLVLAFKKRQATATSISLLWFFSGFLPVPILMFAYLSAMGLVIEPLWFLFTSIGFFLYLGLILKIKKDDSLLNIIKYTIIVLLMLYWGSWTVRYNDIWSSGLSYAKYWLAVVPDNTYALRSIGRDYLRMNDPQDAVIYLKRILRNGEHFSIYSDIGRAYYMMGQLNEGHQYFIKALSLNPHDAFVANNIGLYFMSRNDFNNAGKYFKLAFNNTLNGSIQTSTLGNMMICDYETHQYQEFPKVLDLFIVKNPDPTALLHLTEFTLSLKYLDLALELSKESIRLLPESYDIYFYEGKIYEKYGRYPQAVKFWQDGLRKFPGNKELKNLIGKYQIVLGVKAASS